MALVIKNTPPRPRSALVLLWSAPSLLLDFLSVTIISPDASGL